MLEILFCCWHIWCNVVWSSFCFSVPVLGFKLIPRSQLVDTSWPTPPPHESAWGRGGERWELPKYLTGSWQFLCIISIMQDFSIRWIIIHNILSKKQSSEWVFTHKDLLNVCLSAENDGWSFISVSYQLNKLTPYPNTCCDITTRSSAYHAILILSKRNIPPQTYLMIGAFIYWMGA